MKITATPDISNLQTLDDTTRYVSQCLTQIVSVLNANVTFSDNFKATQISVNFTAANAEQAISHSLGKVPSGYFLVGASVALNLYNGTSDNTDSKIYIKSSAIGTAAIIIF